jgi:hypothetical protein
MTIAEMKEKILARLNDGKGCAVDSCGTCVYRDSEGRACAVGCLIPDDVYDPGAEGPTVANLRIKGGAWSGSSTLRSNKLAAMLNAAGIPATPEVFQFLGAWQTLHDSPYHWDGNKYVGPR